MMNKTRSIGIALLAGLAGCLPPRYITLRNVIESGTIAEVRNSFTTYADASSPIQVGSKPELCSYPLHIAVASGRLPVVKHLLNLGADANATCHQGYTAFFELPRNLDEKTMSSIVAKLVEAGGDINKPEPELQMTPLMLAANAGDGITIQVLLQHGADASLVDIAGRSALDQLKESRLEDIHQVDEIRSLLQHGNDRSDLPSSDDTLGTPSVDPDTND